MLSYKIQTPGVYPEESIQHSEHGESWKSRIIYCCWIMCLMLAVLVWTFGALMYINISTVLGTAHMRPHYNWHSWIYHNFWAQISVSVSDKKSLIFE